MFKLILTLCITLMALTGCSRVAVPEEADKEPTSKQATASIEEIKKKESANLTAQVKEFDLGAGEYKSLSGKIMPYHLRGVIGLPEGAGPFPLVLITHGSHNNLEKDMRFDTGFRYLVEALAQNGYLAVSMDMGSVYLWEYGEGDDLEKSLYLADEHIKSLQNASRGETKEYPVDIEGKIDWQHMAVAGHSRGGTAAIQIAQQQKDLGIDAVLAIAPALPGDMEALEWPSSPISILVPEYDGDVVSLDGFSFDAVLGQKSDQMHAVTYLLKANHNYFNTNITTNDALLGRTKDQLKDQLKPEIQREFLVQYTLDFFNTTLKAMPEDRFYTAAMGQPNKMYGQDVITRLRLPGAAAISDFASQNYEVKGLSANMAVDSWFYQDDQVILDTITFGNGFYKTKDLLNIRWEENMGTLSFAPLKKDMSTSQSLVLGLVVDSADERNGQVQTFTVELIDTLGNSASVLLPPGLNNLRTTAGKLDHTTIDDKELSFWTPITPIGSLRIPLSLFQGVDLTKIETVSLHFDQTKQGALYLEELWIQ